MFKLHYLKLIQAHEQFKDTERARFYGEYMNSRNEMEWHSGNVPIEEIEKLFHFVRQWEQHFQGDPDTFKRIYDANYPVIQSLMTERIEDSSLDDSNMRIRIRYIFDRIADCPKIRRYESTDTSIILHTIQPRLFVMWDNSIKDGVEVYSRGANYSGVFLPEMQKELKEAVKTCMHDERKSRSEAISHIESQCDNKTLAKLADEYNYMKYVEKDPTVQ